VIRGKPSNLDNAKPKKIVQIKWHCRLLKALPNDNISKALASTFPSQSNVAPSTGGLKVG
jgi:hypothetical protein